MANFQDLGVTHPHISLKFRPWVQGERGRLLNGILEHNTESRFKSVSRKASMYYFPSIFSLPLVYHKAKAEKQWKVNNDP